MTPETTPPPGPGPRSTTDRLVLAGGLVFLLGIVLLGAGMIFFAETGRTPGVLAALALLCPVGFAISFAGLVLQARRKAPR